MIAISKLLMRILIKYLQILLSCFYSNVKDNTIYQIFENTLGMSHLASRLSQHLGWLQPISLPISVLAILLLTQPLANVCNKKQQMRNQSFMSLPFTRKPLLEFKAPGFGLAQSWLVWAFEKWNREWKMFSLSVLKIKVKRKKIKLNYEDYL